MEWDVAGLGNALMDALVVLEDDALIEELGLVRGTMHPVDDAAWQAAYERVRSHPVTFDSGGSCANTIATVGRLGGRAIYCGQVGEDQMGHHYAQLIEQACRGHALRFTDAASTGKCLSIITGADAERTMVTHLGAAIRLSELGPFAHTLEQAKVAHFTGYTLLDAPMRQVVMEGMHRAHHAGATVSIDAANPFVVVQIRDLLWTLIEQYAHLVFLNAEEARGLTGQDDLEVAIRAIAERGGVRTAVVKLGARGSLVLWDGELIHVPVHPIHAVDTTGAGDAYAGGFLYGLVHDWAPKQCGALATRVAALTVGQVGAVVHDDALLAKAIAEALEA